MGNLDIKFLGGIESQKHGTSLWWSCQLYTYTVRDEVIKVLLDIGSFVWMNQNNIPNQLDHINLAELSALILTHVHQDHNGRLPEIVKAWYKGPIYMTPESLSLLSPILNDTLKIQRSNIETMKELNKKIWSKLQRALADMTTKRKRDQLNEKTIDNYQKLLDTYGIKKNSDIKNVLHDIPVETTFDEHDILQTIKQVVAIEYGQEFDLGKPGLWSAKFLDAGHVVGSTQVLMDLKWSRRNSHKFPFKLLNTWDLWRFSDNNLLNIPTIPYERVDATVIEGTYGGRIHAKRQPEVDALLEGIKSAENLFVLPAFSLQRFQEIMFVLQQALKSNALKLKKNERIYCISPLAYEFAMILMRQDPQKYWFLADPIFFRVQSKEDIQHVDTITKQRKVVIAGWGMGQGWSSVKYIHQALQNPEAHIWLTGYQATGTLGKEILDKSWTTEWVDLWGKISPVRAHVRQLKSFSSHADEQELVSYMQKLDIRSNHQTIITHGWEQRIDLKNAMQAAGIKTTYHIPDLFDTISIETVKDRRKKMVR